MSCRDSPLYQYMVASSSLVSHFEKPGKASNVSLCWFFSRTHSAGHNFAGNSCIAEIGETSCLFLSYGWYAPKVNAC